MSPQIVPFLLVSPHIGVTSWENLAQSREQAGGARRRELVLKRLSSPYRTGRPDRRWRTDKRSDQADILE